MKMSKPKESEQEKSPTEICIAGKVKFQVYGEEMIDKKVSRSGASGRVYLPPGWAHRNVKIIRMD